ncbi:MAG: hypothetical protein JXB42_13575, partial [Deltaproteobacteria bacterium]|nr:hypothetical protein [Deltaproteobacteria bacterium]
KELMEFCINKLAKYKWPVEIEFRKELPKSNVGKILRKELRAEEFEKREKKGQQDSYQERQFRHSGR